jgi:RNA polymerase sigma-70 factor (ECF subfamily)
LRLAGSFFIDTGPGRDVQLSGEIMPHLIHGPPSREEHFTESSDRELLEEVRRGSEEAFSELMDRKARSLLGLAYRIIGDREEAKDVVQLAFLRVWEHRARYDPQWSPNTWLYRITTNLAIDLLRSQQIRARQAEPVRQHMVRLVGSRSDSDLERIFHGEVMRILRDLASGLSEKQRMVFLLKEVEGLSSREVAQIVGCRESTVRNHLFSARRFLRGEIRRRFPEYLVPRETEEKEGEA